MRWTVIDEGSEPDLKAFEREIGKALQRCGLIAQRLLSTPPPKKPGEKHLAGKLPGGFYTEKQAKFVTIGVKTGTIEVPYMRTGNLPRSWSTSRPMRSDIGEMSVVTFSDQSEAPYNEYVQQTNRNAGQRQVKMHKDWPTPNSVADEYEDKILEPLKKATAKWGFTWK